MILSKFGMLVGLLCLGLVLGGCGGSGNSAVSQVVGARIEAENNGDADSAVAATAAKAVRESAGVAQRTEGGDEAGGTVGESDGALAGDLTGALAEDSAGVERSGDPESAAGADASASKSGIDVDLTQMSSVMVYSEVYNIMLYPDDYLGKTIKIRGPYYASYWDETGKYYHYVIIEDATACCTQGLEFIWDEDTHTYPEEYPEDDTEVEITGVFSVYEEEGLTYYYLATDRIVAE